MPSESGNCYAAYARILRDELVPAMGCTEPAAIALAAARARRVLNEMPLRLTAVVSGNVIKNVHSVIIPATGGMRGIEAAVAAGVTLGDEEAGLGVLTAAPPKRYGEPAQFLAQHAVQVSRSDTEEPFFIEITAYSEQANATVRVQGHHVNAVYIGRNGAPDGAFDRWIPGGAGHANPCADTAALNVRDIVDFAENAPIDLYQDVVERQITLNSAISARGLSEPWGAQIGRVLLHSLGDSLPVRARAAAAAGSDARMSGCDMPVVIVSGSGNQGLTASLPVIEYARALSAPHDRLLAALALSSLITVHQKTRIGCLSAFCGAVCAGCGAGAGIAFLSGGGYDAIAHTVVNALAILSGMVCDGAKPSCAAKIAAAVDAGILGYSMYLNGQQFVSGDGIIHKGVEVNIENVGRIASQGMRDTDREIIRIMLDGSSGT